MVFHPKNNGFLSLNRGQALLEFVGSLLVITPLFLGVIWVGSALYSGTMAASAMREPLLHKLELASISGDSTNAAAAQIMGYGGYLNLHGLPVDAVSVTASDNVTTVLVGRKIIATPFQPFDFRVTQGINGNLLLPNTGPFTNITTIPNFINQAVPLAKNINSNPYGLVNPATYDLQADQLPQDIALQQWNCLQGGIESNISPEDTNDFVGYNDSYTLTLFSKPATMPSAFIETYDSPTPVEDDTLVSLFANEPGMFTACSSIASTNKWTAECNAEQTCLQTGSCGGVTQYGTSVDPYSSDFLPTCLAKKQVGCRIQYAARFLNALSSQMVSGGYCSVLPPGFASGVVYGTDVQY